MRERERGGEGRGGDLILGRAIGCRKSDMHHLLEHTGVDCTMSATPFSTFRKRIL